MVVYNYMLFVKNLMTIVSLGAVLLVLCRLLPTVSEIDSKPNIVNGVTTLKGKDMGNKTPLDVFINNNSTTKRLYKNAQREKRNFLKVFNKFCDISTNTTSTCTPYFIHQTTVAHRKKIRLKKPMYLTTEQSDVLDKNDSLKEKDKFRKLLFPKHSPSPLYVNNSSGLLSNKTKNKKKTTNTVDFMNSHSVNIGSNKESTTLSVDNIALQIKMITTLDPITITNTSGAECHMTASKITGNVTLPPFVTSNNLKTKENQPKGSSLHQKNFNNTTTNRPGYMSSYKHNQFHIKNIFNVVQAPSALCDSIGSTGTATVTGEVLQHYNTSADTCPVDFKTTINETTDQNRTAKPMSTTSMTMHGNKYLNIFHKLKHVRHFFANNSIEESNNFGTAKTVLLETQIPSSPNQQTIEENNKNQILFTTKFDTVVLQNDGKYIHLHNLLLKNRRTTLTNVINSSSEIKSDTLKPYYGDPKLGSGYVSSQPITQDRFELKNYFESQENKILVTHCFPLKKEKNKDKSESNHTFLKTTTSQRKEGLDQSLKTHMVGTKSSTEKTTEISSHGPFKVKYLMKFRCPLSSTKSFSDVSSFMGLRSHETYSDRKKLESNKENFSFEISTQPMDTKDNLKPDSQTSKPSHNHAKYQLKKYQSTLTTKGFQDSFKTKGQNSTDLEECESCSDIDGISTQLTEDTKSSVKDTEFVRHKYNTTNLNGKHSNRKPINPRIKGMRKTVPRNDFKERFNVTVYTENGMKFRHWFFSKTTRHVKNSNDKNENNCTFRWCIESSYNESMPTTKHSPVNKTTEMPTESTEGCNESLSSFSPNKKRKHFFNFKTSQNSVPTNVTTVESASYNVIEETTFITETKPIEQNISNKKYGEKRKKFHSRNYPHMYSTKVDQKPTSRNNTNENPQLEIVTQKLNFSSYHTVDSNVSTEVHRGKVKHFFNRFYSEKEQIIYSNENNSSQKVNGSVILNPEYTDYIETKVEMIKHKKHPNRTLLHNAADVNDTSYNVLALVMKPFDSLVGVFKALSPNTVTKIGDVNATDIKNRSLPFHLQPHNSSIVILAVNNTNATSKDMHESKLDMALDLLGGMYHCMFNSFVEARQEDVHFYLYTRNNIEEPEELFLPQEPLHENVTDDSNLPSPILEKELTSEMPHNKRAIENKEDDYDYYDDYEFEPLNPSKSEIQSKWFNVRAETKVLVHGYLQDYQTDVMVSMKDAYLSHSPYNVVVVDWSVLVGDSSCYPMVASHGLHQVGDLLARLLDHLAQAGLSPSKIHIVGFSLGAHVAGHAGSFLSHGLVSRITGLDPALPYVPMDPDVSLDADDAAFVDIIHSAAGLLGQSGPMGHVDFYPNGGSQQPGCEVSSLSCSHRRAALYFIESITSESGFPAVRCDSWHHFQAENCSSPETTLMGEPCIANTSGKFYLVTGYKSPFALLPEEHVQVKKSLLLDLFYDSEDL